MDRTILVYLKDIVASSRTFEEHLSSLTKVFSRLREVGMTLAKPSKCNFTYSKVKPLGFVVNRESLEPDPAKIEAV